MFRLRVIDGTEAVELRCNQLEYLYLGLMIKNARHQRSCTTLRLTEIFSLINICNESLLLTSAQCDSWTRIIVTYLTHVSLFLSSRLSIIDSSLLTDTRIQLNSGNRKFLTCKILKILAYNRLSSVPFVFY